MVYIYTSKPWPATTLTFHEWPLCLLSITIWMKKNWYWNWYTSDLTPHTSHLRPCVSHLRPLSHLTHLALPLTSLASHFTSLASHLIPLALFLTSLASRLTLLASGLTPLASCFTSLASHLISLATHLTLLASYLWPRALRLKPSGLAPRRGTARHTGIPLIGKIHLLISFFVFPGLFPFVCAEWGVTLGESPRDFVIHSHCFIPLFSNCSIFFLLFHIVFLLQFWSHILIFYSLWFSF